MKSPQEALLTQISETSVGLQFIFQPDVYAKGAAFREPADLVWACNDCIILMYMIQRKHKVRSPEDHKQFRRGMIDHNLNQAKGWLREWRDNNRPIMGENRFQKFNIKYGDYSNVVILSVLDCGDDIGEYHPHFVEKMQVCFCATVPQSALLDIAHSGGSIVEVVKLVGMLAESAAAGRKDVDALEQVQTLTAAEFQEAVNAHSWENKLRTGLDPKILNFMLALRSPSLATLQQLDARIKADEFQAGAVMNDLSQSNIYFLMLMIREVLEGVQSRGGLAWCCLPLGCGYHVSVIAADLRSKGVAEQFMPALDFVFKSKQDPTSRGLLLIIWDTYFDSVVALSAQMNPGKRFLDELIDSYKKPQGAS